MGHDRLLKQGLIKEDLEADTVEAENGPTFVGDEYSDPELMQYLGARKITEPGNNFSTYLTELNVRQVLNLLENRKYRLVGMSGMGQTCVWTMWTSTRSGSDEESDK